MHRRIALVLLGLLVASASPTATAAPAVPQRLTWLVQGSDPVGVLEALRVNPHKVPAEFERNLPWATSSGFLRAMVALSDRAPRTEGFIEQVMHEFEWYGDGPRLYGLVDQSGLKDLLRHRSVVFVEPDYPVDFHLATSVTDVNARGSGGIWSFDPGAGTKGGLTSSVHGLGTGAVTGHGVTAAIIDSGIDHTHRDFGGWDCVPGPYQPCESRIVKAIVIEQRVGAPDPGDELPTTEFASGHGTHVAGIVAGNGYYARDGEASQPRYGGDGYVIGMAPQASLISVKLGDGLSAALGTNALQWTLDHAEEYGIKVANNSWGCNGGCAYNPNSATAQIQKDLYEEGVVTVFSAGNAGDDSGIEGTGPEGIGAGLSGYSQSPYVLSVASYDDETDLLSSFSSRGARDAQLQDPSSWSPQSEGLQPPRRPDIAAPGSYIDSAASLTGGMASIFPRIDPADLDQEPGAFAYTFMSGTSMAAPHVTGAATLLFGACPAARPLDVMRALMGGAARNKIMKSDGSAPAESYEVGYGGLDVRASLDWLLARPPCNGDDVWDPPVATITAPSFSAVGHLVYVEASSSYDPDGQIVAYEWNFGDGSANEFGKDAGHVFEQRGSYVVELTVTDNDGIETSTTHEIAIYNSLGSIIGRVTSAGKGVGNALISCDEAGTRSATRKGRFFFEDVAPVSNRCTASAAGFRSQTKEFTVLGDKPTEVDFKLRKDRAR